MDTTRTAAVVALKPSAYAKSRLGTLPAPLRRRLAWTMAVDTLTALTAALPRVLVVGDEPALASRLRRAGLTVAVQAEVPASHAPGGLHGMNAALQQGAETLFAEGFSSVLAVVGDLPALRAASVTRVVAAAAPFGRAFLADATGIGTTMLIAPRPSLQPHFQGRSAAAHHASGAVALTADRLPEPLADARRDVDTEVDLSTAIPLGLGAATTALLDPHTGWLGRYAVITAAAAGAAGSQQAITADGRRVRLPATALADGLRHAQPGQRLHAVVDAESVLSAWL